MGDNKKKINTNIKIIFMVLGAVLAGTSLAIFDLITLETAISATIGITIGAVIARIMSR